MWILLLCLVSRATAAEASLAPKQEFVEADADTSQRQSEASIEAVEADLKRLATFGSQVRHSLDEADRAKGAVEHALADFRRQSELQQNERDASQAKALRLEEEVATLQKHIQELNAEKKQLQSDKATLTEANRKVLGQLSSMFSFGQSVQTGLAFKGLAQPESTNSTAA